MNLLLNQTTGVSLSNPASYSSSRIRFTPQRGVLTRPQQRLAGGRVTICQSVHSENTAAPTGPREFRGGHDPAWQERSQWQAGLRETAGRMNPRLMKAVGSKLDPPAVLRSVTVVLLEPKFAPTLASVARACNCFECEDLRLVIPRVNPLAKRVMRNACGGQHILHRSHICNTLEEALVGCDAAVAITRWTSETSVERVFKDPHTLVTTLASPEETTTIFPTDLLFAPSQGLTAEDFAVEAPPQPQHPTSEKVDPVAWRRLHTGDPAARTGRMALVFGREDVGIFQEEIEQCTAACAIPMGRLQESMNLSHAVAVVLATFFQVLDANLETHDRSLKNDDSS